MRESMAHLPLSRRLQFCLQTLSIGSHMVSWAGLLSHPCCVVYLKYGLVTQVKVVLMYAGSHSDKQRESASHSAWEYNLLQSSLQVLLDVSHTHRLLAPHAACVYVALQLAIQLDDALFHMHADSALQVVAVEAATSQRFTQVLGPLFQVQIEDAATQSVAVTRAAH